MSITKSYNKQTETYYAYETSYTSDSRIKLKKLYPGVFCMNRYQYRERLKK